ncbi:MAG: hypothetical protein P8Z80_06800 [Pseudolabrys sp.]|jgi:hypothetical protein
MQHSKVGWRAAGAATDGKKSEHQTASAYVIERPVRRIMFNPGGFFNPEI